MIVEASVSAAWETRWDPMTPVDELLTVAKRLTTAAEDADAEGIASPLTALDDAAKKVGRAFSGSWLGYHSRVYYAGLQVPPPGANFSQEWGFQGDSFIGLGSRGDWREFDADEVKAVIYRLAGSPELEPARLSARSVSQLFDSSKAEAISVLEIELSEVPDSFLEKLKTDLEKVKLRSDFEFIRAWSPRGQIMTRDTLALGQGNSVPPHVQVQADIASIRLPFEACKAAAAVCVKAASHLERRARKKIAAARVGTNVFIGHGRSAMWRELKDFVESRLALPWDEFNRVPVAGVTNIARLSEMLDAAAIAFLVARFDHSEGYKLLSLMRASLVVKRHWATA
jgi:hypothetical protein